MSAARDGERGGVVFRVGGLVNHEARAPEGRAGLVNHEARAPEGRAGELFFLPASIAIKIIAAPPIARVPGGPPELRGVALVDGDMIPVVEVDADAARRSDRLDQREARPAGEAMLVCAVLGESLGLVGLEVVSTGRFEPGERPGEISVESGAARSFDVASVIARVREGRWAV